MPKRNGWPQLMEWELVPLLLSVSVRLWTTPWKVVSQVGQGDVAVIAWLVRYWQAENVNIASLDGINYAPRATITCFMGNLRPRRYPLMVFSARGGMHA